MKTLRHASFIPPTHTGSAARLASDVAARIQTIQDTLLPFHSGAIAGLEYAGQCERSGNLGGDFFDFLLPRSNEILACIGNVAVTGVTGSMLTTGLHVCLRLLGRRGVAPSNLADEISRVLWQMAPDHVYATMFCARISAKHRTVSYINAGHETAVILRADGRIERLEPSGPVLGLSKQGVFRERTVRFHPADTLIAVSDGISEAADPADCETELADVLRRAESSHFADLPARILETARDLAAGFPATIQKDRTVIIVRYRPFDSCGSGIDSHRLPLRCAAAAA